MKTLLHAIALVIYLEATMSGAAEQTVNISYSENKALEFLHLSKAAYAFNPQEYLHQELPDHEVLLEKEVDCEFDSKCYAFVSKTNDTITASFRGTKDPLQLFEEGANMFRKRKESRIGGYIHPYFHFAHNELWCEIAITILDAKSRMDTAQPALYVTGHSLGGALAALFAATMSQRGYFKKENILVITFGEPRVGDITFAESYDKLVPNTWRIVHHRDIVPHVPPCQYMPWKQHCADGYAYYYHHGTEVFYSAENMTFGLAAYNICTGFPRNEDKNCSNKLILEQKCYNPAPCLRDHSYYFDIRVNFKNKSFIPHIHFGI